jgi:hypothetical protein
VTPATDNPDLSFTEEDPNMTTELSMTTILSMADPETLESNSTTPSKVNFDELTSLLRKKRKDCRKSPSKTKTGLSAFTCEKLKLSSWLMDELEQNSTSLIETYVKLVKNTKISEITDEAELSPESVPEKLVFRLIKAFGEPVDKLLFYQFKKYTKSRELQVTIPHLVSLEVSPRTRSELETGRTLFDPGFNMKLKFPFFHDELSKSHFALSQISISDQAISA